MLRALPANIMIELKVKDRVLFKDGFQVRDGKVREISPSEDYVKLEYLYMGTYQYNWFKMVDVVEVLLERGNE